jgi:outer membrane receptor protein involved in Fe transport
MPSAGIQFWPEDQLTLYFTYSKGFKAGGINGGDLFTPGDTEFGPESVSAYEVGLKSKLLDETLLLNIALFRSDYEGLQVLALIYNPQLNIAAPRTANAALSRSQGVEMESQWNVTNAFRVSVNITYLNSKYLSYPNAPPTTLELFCATPTHSGDQSCASLFPAGSPSFHDLSGRPTPYAPRWSGGLTMSYNRPVYGNYRFSVELSPFFTSGFYANDANTDDPFYRVGGYARLDGRMALETADGRWAFDLIGKNLTDRVIVSIPGLALSAKEPPRNVAVQFRYRF